MKIKLLGTLALSSVLLLTACGQEDNEKEKDNKAETTKKEEKKEDKLKENKVDNKQKSNEDNTSNEQQESQSNDEQSTEENDYPYTAQQYNELVDEYNALTDGEEMDYVDRGVTTKEYNYLQTRINKEYEKDNDEKFSSEPSTSVDNIEHDNTDDLVTAAEYNDIVKAYNSMENRPGDKSTVNSSVSQSEYNTLVDEYNDLVDQEYEEAGIE